MERERFYWLPPCRDWSGEFGTLSKTDPAEAWSGIVKLARTRLEYVQSERLARAVGRLCGELPPNSLPTRPIRLALLGSSTVDHLTASLRIGGARRDLWVDSYTGSYGQYWQELENPDSGLFRFRPTTVLFAFDAAHIVGHAGEFTASTEADEFTDAAIERVEGFWTMAKERLGASVIQQTLLPVSPPLMGGNEHRLPWSPAYLVSQFNWKLRAAADRARIDLLAIDRAIESDGLDAWHDSALWLRAKQEVRPGAAPAYGDLVARLLAAQQGRASKCLVLDLDNTLWGGTIGDDGLGGIVLGEGNAAGEAFLSFQRYVRRLSRRGVILAVCSKNDEHNARLPFSSHPEMMLKADDIACFVANWSDKASNLRDIAGRLNIGLDSFVFADDNPFERNIVRQELPMVMVPELPEDPARYAACIADAGYFDTTQLTKEDFERATLYRDNAKRRSLESSTTDLAGYLRSLNMQLHYGQFEDISGARVTQLINKTNQFNLTTKRYSEDGVKRLAGDPEAIALHFRLVAQFGDNGIISVVIALPTEHSQVLEIDTWLMSCRVLGRQVEHAAMNVLAEKARQRGIKAFLGRFIPTAKNAMVANHYESFGFLPMGAHENGATLWRLELDRFNPISNPISLIEESL